MIYVYVGMIYYSMNYSTFRKTKDSTVALPVYYFKCFMVSQNHKYKYDKLTLLLQ